MPGAPHPWQPAHGLNAQAAPSSAPAPACTCHTAPATSPKHPRRPCRRPAPAPGSRATLPAPLPPLPPPPWPPASTWRRCSASWTASRPRSGSGRSGRSPAPRRCATATSRACASSRVSRCVAEVWTVVMGQGVHCCGVGAPCSTSQSAPLLHFACGAATMHVPNPRLPSTPTAATIRGLEQQQAELEQRATDVREREWAAAAAAAARSAQPCPNRPSTAAPPCTHLPPARPGTRDGRGGGTAGGAGQDPGGAGCPASAGQGGAGCAGG